MKNQKGFTLVELLAVIVILAVIILIAVNAVLPQMEKARLNSAKDEALNYAKAAETKYVSDSMDGATDPCYSLEDLNGEYVSKNADDYEGYVKLTIGEDGKVTAKTVDIKAGAYHVTGDVLSDEGLTAEKNADAEPTDLCTAPTPGA